MVVLTHKTLGLFYLLFPQSRLALEAWFEAVATASWATPNDLKQSLGNASVLNGPTPDCTRVVFNINGNTYRLVIDILFKRRTIFIVWIGNHKEYDSIDFTKYQRPANPD